MINTYQETLDIKPLITNTTIYYCYVLNNGKFITPEYNRIMKQNNLTEKQIIKLINNE